PIGQPGVRRPQTATVPAGSHLSTRQEAGRNPVGASSALVVLAWRHVAGGRRRLVASDVPTHEVLPAAPAVPRRVAAMAAEESVARRAIVSDHVVVVGHG